MEGEMVGMTESVAIYCRLSREDGDDTESNSIKTQKMIIENYCKRQGWSVYDTYIDDGYSGTNYNRPGFQKMYQDIIDANVNVIITKDLSRLGRNYILTGYYYQVFFPEAGVRYIAVNDHIDTQNDNNDMAISAFKNIMNDLHVKIQGKSIQAARRIRIENKYNCNCKAPYGYFFNNEHVLIPDPDIVPIIRFIYEEYVWNPNASRIAAILNERGVPTRSAYLLHYDLYQNGNVSTQWPRGTPLEIIKNPVYMGAIAIATRKKSNPYKRNYIRIPVNEQEIVYDCHEPMVTRELWEQANALRQQILIKRPGYKPPIRELYAGKLFCAHCGKALKFDVVNGVGYLICKCWPPGPRKSNRGVDTQVLTRHLLYEIRKIAQVCEADETDAYSYIFTHLSSERDMTQVEIEIEINKTLKRMEVLDDKISNFDLYVSTKYLKKKQKDAIFSALESSLKNEEDFLNKLKASDRVLPSGNDIYQFVRAARRYGYIQAIERPMLDEVVDKIYITKKVNETNYQQDRIVVKYIHIGVMREIYKPRSMGTLQLSPDGN
jgi:site-specific DNA recombinase